jgi:hypothetical protein
LENNSSRQERTLKKKKNHLARGKQERVNVFHHFERHPRLRKHKYSAPNTERATDVIKNMEQQYLKWLSRYRGNMLYMFVREETVSSRRNTSKS